MAFAVEGPALAPAAVAHITHRHIALSPILLTGILLLSYGGYGLLVRWGERRPVSELALWRAPFELGAGALTGAVLMIMIYVSLLATGLYQEHQSGAPEWLFQALACFATASLEELLFRGIAFRILARLLGSVPALGISALLFGMAHLIAPDASILAAVGIAVEAGLLLAACLMLTGRIWCAVGLHAAWNYMEGPIFGATVSGHVRPNALLSSSPADGASPLWSGGNFGPEASPVTMLIGLVAFAAVMAVIIQRGRRETGKLA
ncbi:CPBP family intramembrane glutamic endopeptidase [Gluconacetobacter asukensis]|uniref:CPBP family intramembrane metalloprotease n=1 Tax=Gluconacetobacter asukensis TaxID=1017181 RepID=A0A7W4IZ61_9PROT|nr:CPBP family intramembrane glutamic endopeptidase [Gluconacetobacter asukensis]MBB2171578.1 CPBP family intramembrane metalloprotease [Gluconacetobacter asukensis]